MVNNCAKRSNYRLCPQLRKNTFLIFGLIFGIFIVIIVIELSAILYYHKLCRIDSQNKTTNPKATISRLEFHTPTLSRTTFDFYMLLPKMQVPISKSKSEKVTIRSQSHLKIALLNPIYIGSTPGKMWNNYTALRFFQ